MHRTVTIEPAGRGAHRFANWVAESTRPGERVLNIGAGSNRSAPCRAVLNRGPLIVGIDPDEAIDRNEFVHERHRLSVEQYAATEPAPFDVAFCLYVLEHVADPPAFFGSVAHLLKPGGSFFGLTLNMYQYFGLITWAATRLGISEAMLHTLKVEAHEDGEHFPTQYRANSIHSLTGFLADAGFTSVEFRCFEATDRYAWYLPGPLKPLSRGYTKAAYRLGVPSLMGHLSFRAVLGAG